jgi:uncharacterized membrane protein YhhN
MDIIFFFLYGLTAFVNIFSIQREKHIVRFVSKICLVPILVFYYIFKSDNLSFTIVIALFFSWCGDILLVNPVKFRLYTGILSFLAAHILYIFSFIDLTPELNIVVLIFSFLIILLIESFFITKLHIQNNYKFFIIIYGIIIGGLVISSLQVFIWYKSMAGILLAAGSIMFFISDAVLLYFNMIKIMTNNSLSVVMLSYIIAQACIVIGYINI